MDWRRKCPEPGFDGRFWHDSQTCSRHVRTGPLMDTLLAHLLEAAARAPSAHNTQPWRLRWRKDELQVYVSEQRLLRIADPEGLDTLHAIGAVLENLLLTLRQLGFEGEYQVTDNWN